MIWRTTTCIIILFHIQTARGQLSESIASVKQVLDKQEQQEFAYSAKKVKQKYGGSPFSFAFGVYKRFISSQDNNSCSFHPSCSVYGIECVNKHGVFKGGLRAFDRLSRCHGLAPEYYPIEQTTKKLDDPVPQKK